VRTCPECFAAFKPAPMCPCCGSPAKLSAREIQHRDGVLQELERNQQRRQVGKARSLSELLTVAKQRGYAPGWAYRIHYARGKR
jgi:predicted amidophosphoribosyltransferase